MTKPNYHIFYPDRDENDVEMHDWCINIFMVDPYQRQSVQKYGTVDEILRYCRYSMEHDGDITRIYIWKDLEWWGEAARNKEN